MKISRHKTPLSHRVKARTASRWLCSELLGPIAAAAIIGGRYASFCDDTMGLCGYQCGWTGTAGSTNGTKNIARDHGAIKQLPWVPRMRGKSEYFRA